MRPELKYWSGSFRTDCGKPQWSFFSLRYSNLAPLTRKPKSALDTPNCIIYGLLSCYDWLFTFNTAQRLMLSLVNKYATYSLEKKNNFEELNCYNSVAIKVSGILPVSVLALYKHVTCFNIVYLLCKRIIQGVFKNKPNVCCKDFIAHFTAL
jgi:hypothetical protein